MAWQQKSRARILQTNALRNTLHDRAVAAEGMSKRAREEDATSRPPKRQKPDHTNHEHPVEEIHFARQLQQLLTFRQDGIQQLRSGISAFKAFLESILYHRDEDDRARQLSILREFLDGEKPREGNDVEYPFLGHLWQAWSFANHNQNDHLASAVSAIFALLLKTLSGLIDLRDHGVLLCRTVLQNQHLRLIKRCLDAPKHKDFVISPCLRLLIEVTSFDGGIVAREVYKRREQTFDIQLLRRNLGLVRTDIPEDEARRRPSIRTLTVRYILGLLKYLHEGGKSDLLKSRAICSALFQHLRDDPSDLVGEILSTTEQSVLKDGDVPRSAKASILLQQNLERVTEVATRPQHGGAASEKAFAWLKAVCIKSFYGVLRSSGWYPPGITNFDNEQHDDSTIDLGLDSIEFYDQNSRPDVRNTTLLAWMQTLRPHSIPQERELVLTCLTSAPELVAAYFAEKNMQLEPKLSNTWIGYASFLFEVIRLPVPQHLGNEDGSAQIPPQTNIMMESLLPRPLSQKILTRCLNQSSELITFFAIRILVLAFEKLSKVRKMLEQGALASGDHPQLWREASERLLSRFIERCPKMKDVISTFRKTPEDDEHALQREAVTRLLRLFYSVTPMQAMEEQFDISTVLTAALVGTETATQRDDISELRALELEHLLHIARHGTGIRWFSKQGSLEYSPILTLLKVHSKDAHNKQIRELVYHLLSENYVVSTRAACDALVAVLGHIDNYTHVGPFIDDCLIRLTRKPIKYLDDLESLAAATYSDTRAEASEQILPSAFVAVLIEQAPFVLEKDQDARRDVAVFIKSYIELLTKSEEMSEVLKSIYQSITELEGRDWQLEYTGPEDWLEEVRIPEEVSVTESTQETAAEGKQMTIPFEAPPSEPEDHPEIYRWVNKDLELALEEGVIEALMLCLCSQHSDIRKQTLTQLHKLENSLFNSSTEDRNPLYILIGELIETYEYHYVAKNEALPYLAGAFATHALRVQKEPTHFMYPKINAYLNKGPEWRVNKLPTYWIENTILGQPEVDDAYWKEAQWVIDWLVDGLRTPGDLEILRRSGSIEKIMSVHASPGAAAEHRVVRERVWELIWRATFIDGGSTTLITRTGVLSWLGVVGNAAGRVEKTLKKRILETCDHEKVEAWSGLRIDQL